MTARLAGTTIEGLWIPLLCFCPGLSEARRSILFPLAGGFGKAGLQGLPPLQDTGSDSRWAVLKKNFNRTPGFF